MEKKFNKIISGLQRKIDSEKWPSSIFFFKGDKWLFEYNLNSGYLWCRYDLVWDVLSDSDRVEYSDVQSFIKSKVENHFRNREVTPQFELPKDASLVENHFRNREVTPVRSRIRPRCWVENNFRNMEVTPSFLSEFSIGKVEERFKNMEVTPFRLEPPESLPVETHFKNKEVTPMFLRLYPSVKVEEHSEKRKKEGESNHTLFDLLPSLTAYDESGDFLHHAEIPALIFPDGECHFFYKGVYIPHDLFHKLNNNTLTFEDWAREKNEERRSAMLAYIEEVHGGEAAYRLISKNLKEVDTYVDKKAQEFLIGTTGGMNIGVYTLFKGEVDATVVVEDNNGWDRKQNVIMAYVRCYCPSTDRMFFLGVPPRFNNAKDAIASGYRIPRILKPHIKNINRQGERFFTTLTDEGKRLRKKMTKSQYEDLVSVSGDKYFSLMRYEY